MGRGARPYGYTPMLRVLLLMAPAAGCTEESKRMHISLWGSEASQVRDWDGTQYNECSKSGICPCLTQAESGPNIPEPNPERSTGPARQRHLPSTAQTSLLSLALLPSTAVSHSDCPYPLPL